jgi:hypothetical protein
MIRDLGNEDHRTVTRAVRSLDARRINGILSIEELRLMADACLDKQVPATFGERHVARMMLLRDLYAQDLLTAEQECRLYEQSMRPVGVKVRSRVAAGRHFPLAIEYAARVPEGAFMATVRGKSLRIGDVTLPLDSKSTGASGWTDRGESPASGRVPAAGEYDALVEVEIGAQAMLYAPLESGKKLYSRIVEVPVHLVVTEGAPVRLVDEPAAAALLAKMISVEVESETARDGTTSCDLRIDFGAGFPYDAAFEVRIEWNGKSTPIGFVTHWKSTATTARLTFADQSAVEGFGLSREIQAAAAIDVVLVPSPQQAERTLDIVEIWGGEVRHDDVRVPTGTTSDTTTGSPLLNALRELMGGSQRTEGIP